eukprot:2071552-Pyramimonas_sp.AAC.1
MHWGEGEALLDARKNIRELLQSGGGRGQQEPRIPLIEANRGVLTETNTNTSNFLHLERLYLNQRDLSQGSQLAQATVQTTLGLRFSRPPVTPE